MGMGRTRSTSNPFKTKVRTKAGPASPAAIPRSNVTPTPFIAPIPSITSNSPRVLDVEPLCRSKRYLRSLQCARSLTRLRLNNFEALNGRFLHLDFCVSLLVFCLIVSKALKVMYAHPNGSSFLTG